MKTSRGIWILPLQRPKRFQTQCDTIWRMNSGTSDACSLFCDPDALVDRAYGQLKVALTVTSVFMVTLQVIPDTAVQPGPHPPRSDLLATTQVTALFGLTSNEIARPCRKVRGALIPQKRKTGV